MYYMGRKRKRTYEDMKEIGIKSNFSSRKQTELLGINIITNRNHLVQIPFIQK